MMTEPKLEQRNAQPYMGIRIQVPIKAFSTVLPRLLADLRAWMSARGLARAGAPFLRFHVIDTQTRMDIEMGIPVDRALPDDGPVCAGVLPAGRYACLTYTGVSNGIKGNQTLLDWGAAQGLVWDRWEQSSGDAFGARLEFYLTDPDDETDNSRWQTELAIRLADDLPHTRRLLRRPCYGQEHYW